MPRNDAAANDWFGCSVAISQPFVAIGALGWGAQTAQGAVYVYENVAETWTQRMKVVATDGVKGDLFGQAVAIVSDTLLVGARDFNNGTNSGSAYVFRRVGMNWLSEAKLTPAVSAPQQGFGSAVAVHGDLAAIGAPTDGAKGIGAGAVYVFVRTAGVWRQEAKIVAADGASGDRFGCAVSIENNRLAVGAFGSDARAFDAGAAYIFARNATNWVLQGKVSGSDGGAGDRLGYAVSLRGDRLLVGAHRHAYYATVSGAAYLFKWDGANWSQETKVTASNGARGSDGTYWPTSYFPGHFGQAVALSTNRLAIGARLADNSGSGGKGNLCGTVYIYDIE